MGVFAEVSPTRLAEGLARLSVAAEEDDACSMLRKLCLYLLVGSGGSYLTSCCGIIQVSNFHVCGRLRGSNPQLGIALFKFS